MQRSALARKTPLRRRTWMRKKAPRRIARETPAEKHYKAWVHTLPCAVCCTAPADVPYPFRMEQSHERDMTGLGLKESNFRSVAMCSACHLLWGMNHTKFGATKEDRKAWFRCRVLLVHAEFILQHGCIPEDYVPGALRGEGG